MAAAPAALLFVALMLVAVVDPNALLERVADHYASLKTFALEVRQNEESGPMVRGTTKIRLEVGEVNRYYYREVRDNAGSLDSRRPLTIVSDGQTTWSDDPRFPDPVQEEPGLFLDRRAREAMHVLHGRFAMLNGPAMLARYLKSEKVQGRSCVVIGIESRLPEAPDKWKKRLWIGAESATILRSQFTRVSNENGNTSVVLGEYAVPPGQRAPDESLFTAMPGARPRP